MTPDAALAAATAARLAVLAVERDVRGRPLLWVRDVRGKALSHEALVARLLKAGCRVVVTHNEPRRDGVGVVFEEM